MSLFTAAAAPGNIDAGSRAMYQATVDADVCIALYDVGILTAAGDLVTAGLDAVALVDAALTEGITISADVAILILAGGCAGQIPPPAPAANGTLTVFVTDGAGDPISGATVTFDVGESGTTGGDGSFTTGIAYAPGEYPFTASAPGYVAGSGVVTVVDGPASGTVSLALSEVPPAEGTLTVVVTDSDGAPLAGATVVIDGVETGTTGADGSFTTAATYPSGDYPFTASLDGYEPVSGVVSVVDGDATATAALPVAAAPTVGSVEVINFYCPSVTSTQFDGAVADDCVTGGATFTFYLVGDGTDANQQLTVYEDGYGIIDLEAGDYVVVHEGTQAEATITVTAGATTSLVVESPGEAPAPRYGTVNGSAFNCSNIDAVEFFSDNFSLAAALPTEEPACNPGAALFTFYLVGDGTNAFAQLAVDGAGSIQLAPGTYEVVEENTQARTFIDVLPGDFTTLVINIPTGENVPGTSVNVVKYYCDTITETEFIAVNDGTYNREELPGAPDCTPGAATFTFYLVGDGTNDFAQLEVNGAGSIGLLPGTYEVVEEGTLATFTITVVDGENTLLIVNNPMPEDGEVPGTPDDDGDDNGDNGDDDGAEDGDDNGDVKELPSTGSGQATDSQSWMLMAGAAVLSAVGFQITRRQTNS